MHLSSNISHWVCLLAGMYLVLTGIMLRNIAEDQVPAMTTPAGSRNSRRRFAGLGRRSIMIAVGLTAAAYGIFRILP